MYNACLIWHKQAILVGLKFKSNCVYTRLTSLHLNLWKILPSMHIYIYVHTHTHIYQLISSTQTWISWFRWAFCYMTSQNKYLKILNSYVFSSVQSHSHDSLFVTPWTAAHQASLSITNSRSLLKLTVHWVSDVIQPSYPLLSPSPPVFNLFQHQGFFKWVSSLHQVAKVLEFQL